MLISSTHTSPFDYSLINEFINYNDSLKLLDWLENTTLWQLKITDFYSQYEFRLDNQSIMPDYLKFLVDPNFLQGVKAKLGNAFQESLGEDLYIKFHKMTPLQEIKIHNDFLPDETAFRLVIQFNRGWAEGQGGQLLLHENEEGKINRVILPAHNSGIAFKISNNSLHSVTPILEGERYTLVYIFSQRIDKSNL